MKDAHRTDDRDREVGEQEAVERIRMTAELVVSARNEKPHWAVAKEWKSPDQQQPTAGMRPGYTVGGPGRSCTRHWREQYSSRGYKRGSAASVIVGDRIVEDCRQVDVRLRSIDSHTDNWTSQQIETRCE